MKKEQITLKLKDLRVRLTIDSNETISTQIMILAEMLHQYYFTEKQFNNACKKIVEDTSKNYGSMPLFGEFKKLMENQFFKLKTKDEARKDFYLEQKNWVNKQLSKFCKMVKESEEKGNYIFENFISNDFNDSVKQSSIDNFKAVFLRDEDLNADNVKKKIVSIVNTYNQNQIKAIKRMKELFIEKEQGRVNILNIKPMLEFNQEKIGKILNGNIE